MSDDKMDKKELVSGLARYGYELFVPEVSVPSPEKLLEALLSQEDVRLLEGFPVVLANAFSAKKTLAWEKSDWRPGRTLSARGNRLTLLLGLSALLFELFGMSEYHGRATKLLRRLMGEAEAKKQTDLLRGAFSRSEEVELEDAHGGAVELSTGRLKNSFRNYVVHQGSSVKEREEQKNSLEYELLLSELFTLRQKELLRKRLAGTSMTKTEREYYYRVVKKRLKALADSRLHEMARNLVNV